MKNKKTTPGLIIILTLTFLSMGIFATRASTEPLLVAESNNTILGEESLVTMVLQVKNLELDGSIFEDKAFIGLKDFGIEIVKQPVGRINPFRVVGVDDVAEEVVLTVPAPELEVVPADNNDSFFMLIDEGI